MNEINLIYKVIFFSLIIFMLDLYYIFFKVIFSFFVFFLHLIIIFLLFFWNKDDKIEEMINIKSKETLRFKKELFTNKIINLYTQQRIINHFLKRTLLLTQFETLNLNLPLFIKRILIKKYLKINLYDQIIRNIYLLTDISNFNI